ncbi:MAG TPA: hypothetical protein VEF07_11080 [Candidatus Binataceae bacterium]|nr:hypothetical protein [Candidatus Binataceae bacterium]
MGLIESTVPGAGYRLIDPCGSCGREEGVFSVPWPDVPKEEFFLLCDRCLWRKFHDLPKGRIRRELVKKVFVRCVYDKRAEASRSVPSEK